MYDSLAKPTELFRYTDVSSVDRKSKGNRSAADSLWLERFQRKHRLSFDFSFNFHFSTTIYSVASGTAADKSLNRIAAFQAVCGIKATANRQ